MAEVKTLSIDMTHATSICDMSSKHNFSSRNNTIKNIVSVSHRTQTTFVTR